MKKYLTVLLAAVLAVGFSAFTSDSNSANEELFYRYQGVYHPFTGEPCPADNVIQCEKEVDGIGLVPIFTDDQGTPYLTRE